jgi:hypothetical protein
MPKKKIKNHRFKWKKNSTEVHVASALIIHWRAFDISSIMPNFMTHSHTGSDETTFLTASSFWRVAICIHQTSIIQTHDTSERSTKQYSVCTASNARSRRVTMHDYTKHTTKKCGTGLNKILTNCQKILPCV